jgi:hypothetical protein
MNDLLSSLNDDSPSLRRDSPFTAEAVFREILLSYRLIFSSDESSWRRFNKYYSHLEPRNHSMLSTDDPLLKVLCGQTWRSSHPKEIYQEIEAGEPCSFYATSDFPVFGHRLYQIHDFMSQGPRSITALW